MIVSANLERIAKKVYKDVCKFRKKGWFSKDITEFLIKKYVDKKMLIAELTELDKQEKEIWKAKQEIAKKMNKLK